MDAVIPAAGRGSRLGELTADRPKGLVEVAGRPLLAHAFETVVEAGADKLVVIVGYEAAQIVDRFGDTFEGVPITYVHQRERLGLGHAVFQVEPHVDGTFFLLNGDNVFAGSVEPAVEAVGEADAVLGVEAVSPEVAATTGVIETDEAGHVTGLVEKPDDPPSTLVTTGCYVLPEDVFHACALLRPSAEGEYQLSEAVGLLVRAGYEVATVRVGERVNVNTSEDAGRASELVRGEW
ncbi:sugar phosphate nucleotidyltransferase [Halorubrum ezzemoulense]|uniref:sugar phosphate nucleotidyltransferase n=1 Tax=Halorubrum ezzemoulense TaxID=337243 RepID=UPI00232F8933|nr:sugar phosphate nucleotidyltransferase [Halorubrum ezzemoulense]MDB9249113.1 sugar phosphate nucleotidyltransferase [Halorubrum ezzemoulense]MDB9259731.1 sugar phosphate nucleotidyltransferase [Halorubrum ezzemoulense]MDB9263196.1 sugar phosphate nucleotidyltransferase [Halorubrum ezzemoulense]MDB9266373.1 sugar phosphate nucleotidyltransferase [Halorubrum ezzemoulense]MDB9270092.1 sugar phosphate nucleotidyltransferase [Halorubrum ezzemoulense]